MKNSTGTRKTALETISGADLDKALLWLRTKSALCLPSRRTTGKLEVTSLSPRHAHVSCVFPLHSPPCPPLSSLLSLLPLLPLLSEILEGLRADGAAATATFMRRSLLSKFVLLCKHSTAPLTNDGGSRAENPPKSLLVGESSPLAECLKSFNAGSHAALANTGVELANFSRATVS